MPVLILGLVVFVGMHALRLVADGWRERQIARLGHLAWRGIHSTAALGGLVLIVFGVRAARMDPIPVWQPPAWGPMATALLTIPAFVLLVAAAVPANRITARLRHPLIVAIVLWAAGHLLANGYAHDILLFGAILVWAAADYAISCGRDRRAGIVPPPGRTGRDALAVVVGLAAWALFAFVLHRILIGVAPMVR